MIASPLVFNSTRDLKKITELIVKALSNFNHSKREQAVRKDGKEMSSKEKRGLVNLMMREGKLFDQVYKTKSWLEQKGDSEVFFSTKIKSVLSQRGEYE